MLDRLRCRRERHYHVVTTECIGQEVVFENRLALRQLALRHVCFVTFKLGVFLSLLSDVCHAVYLAVATISSLTVDMIHNSSTKRSIMFKVFVSWRVGFNCRWCSGEDCCFCDRNFVCVFSLGFSDCSVSFVLMITI